MPVTPETLTDEMVRAERLAALRSRDGEEQWWRASGYLAHSQAALDEHDRILREAHERIAVCDSALNPHCHAERKTEARRLICDAINARGGR